MSKSTSNRLLLCLQWLTILLFFIVIVGDVVAGIPSFAVDDGFVANRARLLTMTAAIVMATFPEELGFLRPSNAILHNVRGYRHRKRARKFVKDIFQELGPYYVRRVYRMPEEDFWTLLSILQAYLRPKQSPRKRHKNGARNGLITPAIRVRYSHMERRIHD